MSHLSAVSPHLRGALLGTTAAIPIRLPNNVIADTTAPTPAYQFVADADELAETMARGVAAARALIADPKPYRLDTVRLQGMVDAITAIAEASAADPSAVTMPAETYAMLRECIRAERARCAKRGEAWAILETVEQRAAQVMFAFSEGLRRTTNLVTRPLPDAVTGEA